MSSIDLFLNKNQFKKFIKLMPDIGLKMMRKSSAFPLDFDAIYKKKHHIHFEFLSDNLEFYLIPQKDSKILSEIKRKIEKIIK